MGSLGIERETGVCGEAKGKGRESFHLCPIFLLRRRAGGTQVGPGGICENKTAHNTYSCMCTHW